MNQNDNADLEYFLCFFRRKIRSGVRQVDIANSPHVERSASYINKIFLKNPKKIPIDFQESIAKFFGITLADLIEEGREIYKIIHENPQRVVGDGDNNKRTTSLEDMIYNSLLEARKQAVLFSQAQENQNYLSSIIDHCGAAICIYDDTFSVIYHNEPHLKIFGGSGFILQTLNNEKSKIDFWNKVQGKSFTRFERFEKKTYRVTHSRISDPKGTAEIIEIMIDVTNINEELENIKQKIDLLSIACSVQEKSMAVFDDKRRLVYFSRNLGIAAGLEIEPLGAKVEELVFALRSKIVNFNFVEQFLDKFSMKKISEPMLVEFKGGVLVEVQVIPLYRKNKYYGTLVSAMKMD